MTIVDTGTLIDGDNGGTSFSLLAPSQIDDYSGYLIAGTTYYLYVGDTSAEPLNFDLANAYGVVDSGVSQPGQYSTYTPTLSGEYALAVSGYAGDAGTYTLSGGVNENMGTFVGGDVFSNALAPLQQDGYSANLLAGTTYYLVLTNASEPISVSIAGPAGANNITDTLQRGQEISYTPNVSGQYSLAMEGYGGKAGSYTVTGGSASVDLTDVTTSATTTPFMTPYYGPVIGLADDFILVTSHNVNITATTPNTFISLDGGTGEDAIAVNHVNGNNVLNGSTGSSFLYGGSGNDTFFVDDRHATADIWSTVVGFHPGDNATVWGITPGTFDLSWVDGQGASGFSGLSWHATAHGEPTASLTLSGFSSADLTNGRLTVSYGTTPNLPNLPGSNYMLIHCN
jgi:hypothetical protein